MKLLLIPGYKSVFGDIEDSYEELVKDIPSSVIIATAIMLNNELNAPIDDKVNQKRLRDIISYRYSKEQLESLNKGFNKFNKEVDYKYENDVFGRRYLIAMIIKELNDFRSFDFGDTSPEQEYNFLKAYLLIVDEVNKRGDKLVDEIKKHNNEDLYDFRLIWTTILNQFEYNQDVNIGFELFKLLCFFKYTTNNYLPFVKEYINGLKFQTIAQLIGSIAQLAKSTLDYHEEKTFTKLNQIQPLPNVDETHLMAMTINAKIDKQKFQTSDLRKYPLFYNKQLGYMVIDADFYNKKTYRGPFFELLYNTNLKKTLKFNEYSSEISFNVLERMMFQSIIRRLSCSKHDLIYFDNGDDSSPDGYVRRNKTIFIFEFKAYLFPDELSENPDFNKIKNYIDERFISSSKGKKKGILQLIESITSLINRNFDFDEKFNNQLYNRNITIFPVLCHNEFNFTLPGINEYLNGVFFENLPKDISNRIDVKPVILLDIEVLFDFVIRGGTLSVLESYFSRFPDIIKNRIAKLKIDRTNNNFLRSKSSFDEIYRSVFLKELPNIPEGNESMTELLKFTGISQEELDAVL